MDAPIRAILATKGAAVVTIAPELDLATAAAAMTDAGIGALVVSADGRRIDGVLSERDIVRHLVANGANGLASAVHEVMTSEVITCNPDSTVGELMALMTARRIRHVPVEVDGELRGIVSIGDVVKERIDSLELTAQQLEAYVAGSY